MPWLRYLLLILRYGPYLVRLAIKVYDQVERLARIRRELRRPIDSAAKAVAFGERVQRELMLNNRDNLDARRLAELREATWRAKQ